MPAPALPSAYGNGLAAPAPVQRAAQLPNFQPIQGPPGYSGGVHTAVPVAQMTPDQATAFGQLTPAQQTAHNELGSLSPQERDAFQSWVNTHYAPEPTAADIAKVRAAEARPNISPAAGLQAYAAFHQGPPGPAYKPNATAQRQQDQSQARSRSEFGRRGPAR